MNINTGNINTGNINANRQTWQHNAEHRGGVAYRNNEVSQRYQGANAQRGGMTREQARGFQGGAAGGTAQTRANAAAQTRGGTAAQTRGSTASQQSARAMTRWPPSTPGGLDVAIARTAIG